MFEAYVKILLEQDTPLLDSLYLLGGLVSFAARHKDRLAPFNVWSQ